MTEKTPDKNPMDVVRDGLDEKIGFLLDYNQKAVAVLRRQAKDFERVAEFFQAMRDRALDIADDTATLAMLVSEATGDILSAEFQEIDGDGDGEDERGDDDEESA